MSWVNIQIVFKVHMKTNSNGEAPMSSNWKSVKKQMLLQLKKNRYISMETTN